MKKLSIFVSVHAPNKAAVNSPVKSSAPTGPARSVLPVHDEPARGRKPLLRDELAAVETKGQYPGEHLRIFLSSAWVAVLIVACGGGGASGGAGASSTASTSAKSIVYKPATPDINARGEAFIQEVLNSVEIAQERAKKSPLICGPFLWVQIRYHPDVAVIEKGQTFMMIPTANGMQRLEGKMFQSEDEVQRFWRALYSTIKIFEFNVRKLNEREKEIYWSMISWDIEEPVFIIEGSGYKLLIDFVVEDDGGLKIFWVDEISQVGFSK
jgi:hypothetical protein